ILEQNQTNKIKIPTEDKINSLPPIIQKWLRNSGIVGKEMIRTVRLKQKGQMKMKPEQDKWYV
ncbi:MAG: DUF6544 family protein, partial [Ignavibacterium sp.]|uniref:DUF6544 family protein n=1 Tax=Ignavibacterium sp. TaxID=2651167 RepID=UPI004049E061